MEEAWGAKERSSRQCVSPCLEDWTWVFGTLTTRMGLELQLVESYRYRGITSTGQAPAFHLSALPLSIWNDHEGASFQGAVDKGAGRAVVARFDYWNR